MTATRLPSHTSRAPNTWLPRVRAMLGACAVAAATTSAFAQTPEPGDIIVERQVMAHDAFQSVPTSDDPVVVRATTFPATTFDQAIATLVTDADLTGAHGSGGVSTSAGNDSASASAAGLGSITKMLSGSGTGSNVAMGPGASGQAGPTGGIGATISMSVTGALAPLQSLGGAR